MRSSRLVAVIGLTFVVGAACENRSGLNVEPSPSPTPSTAVTVTPSPCATSTVGPPPNVTTTSLDCGNANKAVSTVDTLDGDGDAFICVWICTAEPETTPHEELQTWNLTADDGDANTLISTTTLPCCTWNP